MPKYKVIVLKENGKYYETIVEEAKDEKEAFFKARDEAQTKGIDLPNEGWTSVVAL